jgi:porphobilinogen synthase
MLAFFSHQALYDKNDNDYHFFDMTASKSSNVDRQTTEIDSSSQSEAPLKPIFHRPRRLRRTETLRRMVRENILRVEDLIYPVFVMEGEGQREEVASMPGCYRYTLDLLLDEMREVDRLGIGAIALFPLIPDKLKDNTGTESYNSKGLIPRAVRAIKQAVPDLLVITTSVASMP